MTLKQHNKKFHPTIKGVFSLSEYEISQLEKLTFGRQGDMQAALWHALADTSSADEVILIRGCTDKIIGWCLVRNLGDSGCDFDTHLSFFVAPTYRRQGIGRLLVQIALAMSNHPIMTMHCLDNGDWRLFEQYREQFIEIR